MSLSIRAGALLNRGVEAEAKGGSLFKVNGKASVNAGDLRRAPDKIAQRKKQAREEAWRVVSSAWENDKSIDRSIEERRAHYKEMEAVLKEKSDLVDKCEEELANLKKSYGIEEGSKEAEDMELLLRFENKMSGIKDENFTEEEKERLNELLTSPLTEAQQLALDINARANTLKRQMNNAKLHMQNDVSYITNITIERLKSSPMVDADKQADSIMEAAGEEIMGMLFDEMKEHIDEKQEENKEKAEAVKEEREEEEEQLAEIKEERAIKEAMILQTKEAIEAAKRAIAEHEAQRVDSGEMVKISVESVAASNEAQLSLDKIKNSMALVEADFKGIKVDETV